MFQDGILDILFFVAAYLLPIRASCGCWPCRLLLSTLLKTSTLHNSPGAAGTQLPRNSEQQAHDPLMNSNEAAKKNALTSTLTHSSSQQKNA